jgi:hypothetical protein
VTQRAPVRLLLVLAEKLLWVVIGMALGAGAVFYLSYSAVALIAGLLIATIILAAAHSIEQQVPLSVAVPPGAAK